MTTAPALQLGTNRTILKPWGHETIFTEATLPYVGKLIHVRAGCRLSLQVHDRKTETMTVLKGRAVLVLEQPDGSLENILMEPGRGYTIVPGMRHRLCGISNTDVLEVSSPEIGTTFRLEDDYSRSDERRD